MASPATHNNPDHLTMRNTAAPPMASSLEILRPATIRTRFLSSAIWSFMGLAVSQALGLLVSTLNARQLGKEHFGELGIIQTTIGVLGTIAGIGLGLTATKYIAQYRVAERHRVGHLIACSNTFAILSGGLISLLLFVFAPRIALSALKAPHLVGSLRLAAILLFVTAYNGTQSGALAGFEAFRAIACANGLRAGLALPLTLLMVPWWHVNGAVLAIILATTAALVYSEFAIRAQCQALGFPVRLKGCMAEKRILWVFSIPSLLAAVIVGPVTWASSALLVNQPGGYGEMGLFSAASQWRMAIVFIPQVLSQPLLSMLCNLGEARRGDAFRKLLKANLFLNLAICSAAAAVVICARPYILAAYGHEFASASTVLTLLVLSSVVSCTANVIGQAVASLGKMWWNVIISCVWAAVQLMCAFIMVPKYRAVGLAASFLVSYLIHAATVATYTYSALRGHMAAGDGRHCLGEEEMLSTAESL